MTEYLSKMCCGHSLRTGAIVVGVINLIIVIVPFIIDRSVMRVNLNFYEYIMLKTHPSSSQFYMFVSMCYGVGALLLIFGAIQVSDIGD